MSDVNNLVYICVHCGQVVENKDSEWHERQCPGKSVTIEDDQEDIELNVEEVEEETPEEKQVEKDDYVVRLVNAVRHRTLLWDKFQKRDIPGRQKLWEEIEHELGTQPGVPRRDWTHLREKYRTDKSSMRKAAQAGRQFTSRWEYFDLLTFLEQDPPPRPQQPSPVKIAALKPPGTRLAAVNGKVITRNFVTRAKPGSKPRAKPGPKPGSKNAPKSGTNNNQLRAKPGPKPGSKNGSKSRINHVHSKSVRQITQKPITRPKRSIKPTESQTAVKPINNARDIGKLNELRVLVPRNDYRDLAARKSLQDISMVNDPNSRKRNSQCMKSQQDVDSGVTCKQVCIRSSEETPAKNSNDDTVGKFCSYLEVMLRTLPKEKQEVFYEETLDHLATLKRQIRRSNHSNSAANYM